MPALEYQVALVTGGGSGIGLGIVKRFVAEGARVMVLERVPERVTELESEFGGSVKAIQGDVTRLADNQRAVSEAVSAFGKLDIFIANAGVFDRFRRLDEIDDEILESAFDELFAVNVKGCFLGAKAALPELIKTQGSMTFTASGAGLNSLGGGTIYTASKHAVVGLVRQLAVESAPQVRVNAVAPGLVLARESMSEAAVEREVQSTLLRRSGTPEDLTRTVLFLVESLFITGQTIVVDGGGTLDETPGFY